MIHRYRAKIRARNALQRDPHLVELIAGDLVQGAEQARQRLVRLARDPATPPRERILSEQAGWRFRIECIDALQRLGCLPSELDAQAADADERPMRPLSTAEILATLTKLKELAKSNTPSGRKTLRDVERCIGQAQRMLLQEETNALSRALEQ